MNSDVINSDIQKMIKTGAKLAVICAVAGLVLAIVNAMTAPQIEINRQEKLRLALEAVMPAGMEAGESGDVSDHEVVEKQFLLTMNGDVSGVILQLVGKGYGGDLLIMASYSLDGSILGVSLTENSETPGIGKKAEVEGYMDKFLGTGGESPVPVRKNQLKQSDADAVTAATVTFSAIAKALAAGSSYAVQLGQGGVQ